MPRFVILAHDHPFEHWDFLLESNGVCRTWRLLDNPESTTGVIRAEPLDDHRLFYLDYEGPVSGNRGRVSRWDQGEFEWRMNSADVCEVVLNGLRWKGLIRLSHANGDLWTCDRVSLKKDQVQASEPGLSEQ